MFTTPKLMYYFQFSVITTSSMDYRVQFTRIFLETMMTIYVTQAMFVQNLYRKLESAEDIAGVVIAQQKAVSPIECSGM